MIETKESALASFTEKYAIKVLRCLKGFDLVKERRSIIPYHIAKQHRALPVEVAADHVVVAMTDPLALSTLEEMRFYIGAPIKEITATEEALEEALQLCYHSSEPIIAEDDQRASSEPSPTSLSSDGYDLLEERSSTPVAHLLNTILKEAIQMGASDIHFEPQEMAMQVRYRIDGVLSTRHTPSKEQVSQLITRIKVMSQLDIAEQRLPQDGRMKLRLAARHIDLRVSSIPSAFGERIVLRILDKSNIMVGLSKIGMKQDALRRFRKLIHLPEGIVLVTGPTGSGKTTTLYSALSDINSSEVNIMTIEDPVEYKLEGMAQIGVNPKIALSFAAGLRHILRQDPDVIMIGEIRDKETAEIAIQASLTGHMVMSTLHTNDAPSALTRLIDMGIEPYLLTSSVVGILAQRLVRMICQSCRVSYEPTGEQRKEFGLSPNQLLYKGTGCLACFGTGYKGRQGIYELMVMSEEIKRQLLRSADASMLRSIALEEGMGALRDEGLSLVRDGITTESEVLRVTRGLV